MSDKKNIQSSIESKYQYKSGTILYEEDIHYNNVEHKISDKICNQNIIKEILDNYRKNNMPRLYEEYTYPN
jgi:hypothetical protein